MSDPFNSVRVKLGRTRQLIDQLESAINSYDGAKLVPEQIDANMIGWTVRVSHEPDEVVAVLGDAVHNMRASLDHLAVTVVGLNNGNTKNVYFPFADSADELDGQINRKHFDRASPEAVDLLKSLKPYRGGNAALRAIHDLDVMDKHHTLIPVYGVGAQQKEITWGTHGRMALGTFGLQDGNQALAHGGTGGAPLAPLTLKLIAKFDEGQPFAGSELVPTLQGLNELVLGMSQSFAALYSR